MREIKITHNQVLSNLNNFRLFLHENHLEKGRKKERVYPIWLDRETGVIEFEEKKGAPIGSKKELQLLVRESSDGIAHFELKGDLSHTEILTQKVAQETLRILNLLSIQGAKKLPEEQVLQDLSEVHLESWHDRIEMFPAWHGSCKRMAAETLLKDKPIGTYLLRRGEELTQWMVAQYPLHTKGYLLTVVEEGEKISDYLILKTDRGWTILNDEPDLTKYHYFPTLAMLLENSREIAMTPYS